MKREKFRYAGQTVKVKDEVEKYGGEDFTIEDYWENVYGTSWMNSNGNPAALTYAARIGCQKFNVPLNNEVVYGKIGPHGFLFHVSELVFQNE